MASWESAAMLYGPRRSVISHQIAPTEPAPTDAHDGCPLQDVGGFTLHVECDEGSTFTAAGGKFLAYLFNPTVQRWSRSADKTLDLVVPSEAVGQRSIAFSGFVVGVPRDRLAHVAFGVGVSSGGLTLYYMVTSLLGDAA